MPIVNEIASLKECLNETMSQLREDLEEHKNRTTSKLADLQSSIDNPPSGIVSRTVLLTLLPYLNYIEENIITDLSSLISDRTTSIENSVSSLSGYFEEHKNQTTSELADLQTYSSDVQNCHKVSGLYLAHPGM